MKKYRLNRKKFSEFLLTLAVIGAWVMFSVWFIALWIEHPNW